jgi:hypothetical protein
MTASEAISIVESLASMRPLATATLSLDAADALVAEIRQLNRQVEHLEGKTEELRREILRRPKLVVVDAQQPNQELYADDLPRLYGMEITRPTVTIKLTTDNAEYVFKAVPTDCDVLMPRKVDDRMPPST